MDRKRVTVLASVWVLSAVVATSTPVAAYSECTADSSNAYYCEFTCTGFGIVWVGVDGPAAVAGSADCGVSFASCSGTQSCDDLKPVLDQTGTGGCRALSGTSARCVSHEG